MIQQPKSALKRPLHHHHHYAIAPLPVAESFGNLNVPTALMAY